MSYTISKEDNYCLVTVLPGAFGEAEKDQMVTGVHNALKKLPWVIINLSNAVKLDAMELKALSEIKDSAEKFNGGMIVSGLSKELTPKIKEIDKDIVCLPTNSEAVDYVFMEQLEQDFDDDDY